MTYEPTPFVSPQPSIPPIKTVPQRDQELFTEAKPKNDDDGFSFGDFLDIINPLQHIPIIGTIYRNITGDEIDPEARLIGGGLFGGVIGAAIAGADVAVEETTGKNMGDHAVAMLGIGVPDETPQTLPEIPVQLAAREKEEKAPVLFSFVDQEEQRGTSILANSDYLDLQIKALDLETAIDLKRTEKDRGKPFQFS